ncbi:MAG: HlyD family efflux transporter periplasmic adaptor subunit, partial [Planctomycetales bacterium]|nr:HlyD family efflux transporter periplasmic adaptor subunit [Planctomycetales bacterium]
SNQPPQPDLSQLAVDRARPAPSNLKLKRVWLTRYALPAGILIGFVLLFCWAARDSFLPARTITITPVVVSRAEVTQEGTPLFQAAGWVEPRPSPVVCSSLASGVIQQVLVIEGQQVEKEEPVARLIDTDARLAVAKAEASHKLQLAELRRAEAQLAAAKTNLSQPVTLQAAHAEAAASVAETRRELESLPFSLEAARTRRELAAENVRRKEQAGGAVSGRALREARAELAEAETAIQQLSASRESLASQLQSLTSRREALAERLHLLTEERRAVAEADANLEIASAQLEQTRLAVETARLTLDRMIVRAPITGRVLSVEARPGQRLSGINPHSEQGSSAVISLYDPESLQVRVDVRLEDVPQVQMGQQAQIETAALAEPMEGEVISVTTRANIQKNTLQVKVAIKNPPPVIKPEMLGKVTFLAPPTAEHEDGEKSPSLRLFIPRSLVTSTDEGDSVWVADLTAGVAKRRSIEVGHGVAEGGLVEVLRGLSPTDKLIVEGRESLTNGARVRVAGDDKSLAGDGPGPRSAQIVTHAY